MHLEMSHLSFKTYMSNLSNTKPLKYVEDIISQRLLPLFFKEHQDNLYPPTQSHFSLRQVTQFDSLSMLSGSVAFSKAEL